MIRLEVDPEFPRRASATSAAGEVVTLEDPEAKSDRGLPGRAPIWAGSACLPIDSRRLGLSGSWVVGLGGRPALSTINKVAALRSTPVLAEVVD